jgi:Zn finger protein HypA/HybF involved in hydrogenase expression
MKNFVRKKENFECEKCGEKVKGDGYTDHCPKCLWGKHVDEDIPGDRKSKCGGLMRPVGTIYEKERFKIFYRCERCGQEFGVREGEGDDREKMMELVNN